MSDGAFLPGHFYRRKDMVGLVYFCARDRLSGLDHLVFVDMKNAELVDARAIDPAWFEEVRAEGGGLLPPVNS